MIQNNFLVNELDYDREQLANELGRYLASMNEDQKIVVHEIMKAVEDDKGGFYFVYGYGGTWKM